MTTLRWLLFSTVLTVGCSSDKPVEMKKKEEALHRGLTEAAKKADPAKNLKEASDAIRSFKISDAADAGFKRHQAETQQHKETTSPAPGKSESKPKPSQPSPLERKSP